MAIFQYISVSVWLAAVVAVSAAGASGVQATLVDGKVVEGALAGRGGDIALDSSSGNLPLSALARVTFEDYRQSAQLVAGAVARDGGTVRGRARVNSDGAVEVASARLGSLTLKLADVAEVLFECRKPFPPGATAGVLLANGDFVAADSVALAEDAVRIKSAFGDVELPYERVAAVRIANPSPPAQASVVLENGDVINGRLAAASANTVTVESPFGQVAVPAATIIEIVMPGRMAYLSDLESSAATEGFAPKGPEYWKADSNPGSDGLWSVDCGYRKGLFIRAGAAVTVTLPQGAQALHFIPALARGANPPSGRFSVMAAGKEIWAKSVGAGMKAEPVTISVAGAKEVTFLYMSSPAGLIGSTGVLGDAFVTILSK